VARSGLCYDARPFTRSVGVIWLLYIVHAIVCVVLILVVLLQSGKAADLAGAFGGGGSQTALGSRGAATVLSKATTVCAVIFMLTSLTLAILGSRRGGSVLEQVPVAAPPGPAASAPATPAPSPAQPQGTPAPAAPAPAQPGTGSTPPASKPGGGSGGR
jgi:preprotein translocase subunit SecG